MADVSSNGDHKVSNFASKTFFALFSISQKQNPYFPLLPWRQLPLAGLIVVNSLSSFFAPHWVLSKWVGYWLQTYLLVKNARFFHWIKKGKEFIEFLLGNGINLWSWQRAQLRWVPSRWTQLFPLYRSPSPQTTLLNPSPFPISRWLRLKPVAIIWSSDGWQEIPG